MSAAPSLVLAPERFRLHDALELAISRAGYLKKQVAADLDMDASQFSRELDRARLRLAELERFPVAVLREWFSLLAPQVGLRVQPTKAQKHAALHAAVEALSRYLQMASEDEEGGT